ncbi:Hemolysins-related protein containing CBS domains [Halalkaliarchaeum sp. AArc-CO]|uniref:hemolysin family protein n=1 Tax=Halalkaliarchaeum sp. AArc-CO TaxID=2866381 RepID=UPI00217CD60C|nr:hemolysin family protein [Halalkaliarchaeum sp. AArc-CO]UWG49393.1 Hemolysins-related protein containing CBS domains [Halalkaliarchaeum sp. AArc-CO]
MAEPLLAAIDGTFLAGLASILVLIGVSAFFSSSELALFSLAQHRVDALEAESRAGAVVARLRDDPHRLLVTVLVGNNVANIAAASIATAVLVRTLPSGEAVAVSTVFTSFFVLILGEIAPKSYAVTNAEPWALRVSRPLALATRVMYPVVYVFEVATRAVNRLTGGSSEFETYLTREDIETIVTTGERTGALDSDEGSIIRSVLDLEETPVKAVMVPRRDMVTVPVDAELDTVIDTCVDATVTRVPVYGNNRDDVRGIVDVRDVLAARRAGGSLADAMEEPRFVPATMSVDDLLAEMQRDGRRMVLVVDEFGSVDGLATLEDVLEEVVGEIVDVHESEPIEVVDATTAVVRGWTTVEYANESLDISLPTADVYETVAGLLAAHAGRLVEEGERFEFGDATVTVLSASPTRVLRVRIERTRSES